MRLCFQFHPDKNKGREELMTKAFQYLQNAFEKGVVDSDDEKAGINLELIVILRGVLPSG